MSEFVLLPMNYMNDFFPIRGRAEKLIFSQVLPGNSIEIYVSEEYCDQDWRLCLKNSY